MTEIETLTWKRNVLAGGKRECVSQGRRNTAISSTGIWDMFLDREEQKGTVLALAAGGAR